MLEDVLFKIGGGILVLFVASLIVIFTMWGFQEYRLSKMEQKTYTKIVKITDVEDMEVWDNSANMSHHYYYMNFDGGKVSINESEYNILKHIIGSDIVVNVTDYYDKGELKLTRYNFKGGTKCLK